MKNFKYFLIFTFSFSLLSESLLALRVNGKLIEFFEEANSSHTTLSVTTSGSENKNEEPNIQTKWTKPRRTSFLTTSSHVSIDGLVQPKPRLRKATSARVRTDDKVTLAGGSPKSSPSQERKKAKESPTLSQRDKKKSVVRTENPLYQGNKLGKKYLLLRSLDKPSSLKETFSAHDFGIGDATLRRVSLPAKSLLSNPPEAEKSDASEVPELELISIPFGQQNVDLQGRSGRLSITNSGPIPSQHYSGLVTDTFVEVYFSDLCTLRVFPANLQNPLTLKSGSFEPKFLLLSLNFENCGKVTILPPTTEEK